MFVIDLMFVSPELQTQDSAPFQAGVSPDIPELIFQHSIFIPGRVSTPGSWDGSIPQLN